MNAPAVFGQATEIVFRGTVLGRAEYMAPRRWRVVLPGVVPFAFYGTEANVKNHVIERAKAERQAAADEWAADFLRTKGASADAELMRGQADYLSMTTEGVFA